MAGPLVKTCCLCQSLRMGSIVSGVTGILLAIATLVLIFTVHLEFKTIFFDYFPSWVVKIILAINLCMTIFISTLLIIGAYKVCAIDNTRRTFWIPMTQCDHTWFSAKSLPDDAVGGVGHNAGRRFAGDCRIYVRHVYHWWIHVERSAVADLWTDMGWWVFRWFHAL